PAPSEPEPSRPLAPSRPADEEPAVQSPLSDDDGARFKRGRIIHRLLETLPALDTDARRAAAVAWLARPGHGLTSEEQKAMAEETFRVLEDAAFAPLFGPGSRAEAPLIGEVGGTVLSARIDRLLVTDSAVTIVDFKTNRPPPGDAAHVPETYLRQMAAYRAALSAIYPDKSIICLLLWTDGPDIMILSDALLDAHAPGNTA
ncbi:MAG: PD-(D/E)XK nuclease family protein, partial [Rhodospirillales bacterium]|nr:PD-(D/E)XK nuclease family protein [Rhodospirillales bacterium]